MAAPPDSTKVRPAMPMNSASSRRSRCLGLAQSAQPRCPPTDAIRAARPTRSGPRAGAAVPPVVLMSGFPRVRRHVGRAGVREVDRDDDLVVQVFADAVGQRGLLEGQVVVDGI